MLQKKAPKNKKTKKEIRQKYWWNYSPPPPAPQLRGPCMFAPEMTSNPVFDFDGERGGGGGGGGGGR